jgi:hypothetical protein
VAARPNPNGTFDDLFKKRLLRIVTEQLSEKKIICDVSLSTGDASKEIFKLKTDHKWP